MSLSKKVMPPTASLRTGRSCAQYSLITADREQSGGAERVGRVAASKGKDARDKLQFSLIPVIERQQEQLRKELDQAEQNIQQGRQSASELTEQTRKKKTLRDADPGRRSECSCPGRFFARGLTG